MRFIWLLFLAALLPLLFADLRVRASSRLFIKMDFASGKAVAQYKGIRCSYNGWVGLYNKHGERQTYEWTYGKTAGEIKFSSSSGYVSKGHEVRFFTGRSESTLSLTSDRWLGCNYRGWKHLNKLPASYGRSYIKLLIDNGYPMVKLEIGNTNAIDAYDTVYLQTIDQMGSEDYWSYQWVTSMTVNGNERYYKFSRPDSSLSQGFRVKYFYATSESYYVPGSAMADPNDHDSVEITYTLHGEGTYDNASPIWTPEDCEGTVI